MNTNDTEKLNNLWAMGKTPEEAHKLLPHLRVKQIEIYFRKKDRDWERFQKVVLGD